MKRIICLVSALVILALSAVSVSATGENSIAQKNQRAKASVADTSFELNVVSENDKQAVLSFDFAGGKSFSALDFEVKANEKKVKIVAIDEGDGLFNFKKQATVIFMANVNKNPAEVSAAMMPGYRNVDGKDLFKITLEKLTKEKLTANDVVIVITNCTDDKHKALNISVNSLLGKADTENSETKPSEGESSTSATVTESSTSATDTTSTSVQIVTDAQGNTLDVEANKQENADGATATEKTGEEKDDNKTTVIIICAIAAVVVAGGAGAAVIVIKKKNKSGKEV